MTVSDYRRAHCLRGATRWVVVLALGAGVRVAQAAPPLVEACKGAVQKSGASNLRSAPLQLGLGGQKIVYGDTDQGGAICALATTTNGLVVTDYRAGIDEVGRITSAEVATVGGQQFLVTVQSFRGGSNHHRQLYVVYGLASGKLRTVLEVANRSVLVVGEFRASESNDLAASEEGVTLHEVAALGRSAVPREEVLYRSSRKVVLRFDRELFAFVEGTGECQDQLADGGDVWLRKGERFGYLFSPRFDEGGQFGMWIIRQDGTKKWMGDLGLLVFLKLSAPLRRP